MSTPTVEQVHLMLLEIRDREPVFGRITDDGYAVLFFPSLASPPDTIKGWMVGGGIGTWSNLVAGTRTHQATTPQELGLIHAAALSHYYGNPQTKPLHVPGDTRTFRKLRQLKEN